MTGRRLLIITNGSRFASDTCCHAHEAQLFVASSAYQAEAIVRKQEPQVVILDLSLADRPGGNRAGLDLLERCAVLRPDCKVIVIHDPAEHDVAVAAVAKGAYDCYPNSVTSEKLAFAVERAFHLWELEADHRRQTRQATACAIEGLPSTSKKMFELAKQTERIAPTDAMVLLVGETGTGKTSLARTIHGLSSGAQGAFVVVDCAALSERALDDVLFGGPGSVAGKIEAANGGTLLLERVEALSARLQSKLLRFLEKRAIERPSVNESVPVDARILSSSLNNINDMVDENLFRRDLYFRISEVSLTLPPLRERLGDVILLGKALVTRYRGARNIQLSKDCMAAMENWPWMGNMRELNNRIRRACIVADGRFITPRDLEIDSHDEDATLNLKEVRAEAERQVILRALNRSNDNVSQAARLLGVSRPTLYNLFSKHGLALEANNA